jgi:hypothetical protein
MKQTLFTFLLSLLAIFPLSGQITLDDLNIIFKHNFENNTVGDYQRNEWLTDFNYPSWDNRQSTTDISVDQNDQVNPSKALQIYYPQGSLGAEQGGASWYAPIPKTDEAYVSYDIFFMPGFQYKLGGKMPSVQGGTIYSGSKPDGYNGFSGGLMFHADGLVSFYLYYPDAVEATYGTTAYWGAGYSRDIFSPSQMKVEYTSGDGAYCNPGEWHNITYRIVMNTVNAGGGNYDGILEAYFDGKLVMELSHVLFRHTTDLHIDCLRLYTFFGGNTADWATPINEWIKVDNILIYTFKDGIDVPRGTTLSPANRTLNYWRNFLTAYNEAPACPQNLRTYDRTKSSIILKWNDVSGIEHGFKLYRSTSADGNYQEIGTVTANVTTFTDKSLDQNTTYFYKILAYNNVGESELSNALQASTLGLQIPAAPDNFVMQSLNLTECTIAWQDRSGNETGFEIEREGPDPSGTIVTYQVAANTTSYKDVGLKMNSNYRYRIRSYNTDGYSTYTTNTIQITTPYVAVPPAPSLLKGTQSTDSSITITWKDNSVNESAFIITRSTITTPVQKQTIQVDANDTVFTDNSLFSGTSYQYTVQAINVAGTSANSNKRIVTTLSTSEMKRVKDGLIAYYNFSYSPDLIIYDQSGYGEPLDLRIQNSSAVTWNDESKLNVKANTMLISFLPAKKIINAVKSTKELSIECWVKPIEPGWMDNARIISLSSDDNHLGFAVDQKLIDENGEKHLDYRVRVQTGSTNESGYPEFTPENNTSYITLNHIVYTRDSIGTECMYLNGHKSSEGYRPDDFGNWTNSYFLRLANETDANHSWQGTFYEVALYNKALSGGEIRQNFFAGASDSVRNVPIDYQVKVYPNPIHSSARVEINPLSEQDIMDHTVISLSDIYGRILYTRSVFNPGRQNIVDIDFSNFTNGIYILRVGSGTHLTSTKLIVQKP